VVGGRSFSETQLNRAVNSKRQVGSVFKPFVFLTAFSDPEIKSEAGQPYTPLTLMQDEPFTVEYDKQSWSPKKL
jgi:penicillin-binding protein 1B